MRLKKPMLKKLLTLGLALLATSSYAQLGTHAGYTETPFASRDLTAALGISSSYSLSVGNQGYVYITWQTSFSAAPAAITTTLEGSTDCINFATIDTSTSINGEIRSVSGVYKCIRFNNSSVTTGAGKTLTLSFFYSYKQAQNTYNTIKTLSSQGALVESEITGTSAFNYGGLGVASGTFTVDATPVRDHPGTGKFNAHATNANSGACYTTAGTFLVIQGGEKFQLIFRPDILTNVTTYAGFSNTFNSSAPTDGIYLKITGTTLQGQSAAASVTTTTASSYTVSTATWYNALIEVNSAGTLAKFSLYSSTGNLLWTDVVSSNIPSTTNYTGIQAISTVSTSPGALSLTTIDYIGYLPSIPLAR